MDVWTPRGTPAALAGLCLIAGPLLMLLSDVSFLLIESPVFWPTLTLWASFFLFVPAVIALSARSGMGGLSLWGALAALFGCLMGVTIVGQERVMWSMQLHGISRDTLSEVMMEPALFLSSRAPGLDFPLGLL
ncbi:MAG: hypothetical protein RLN75_09225, partial [Longimicrobiales bacterium]